MKKLRAYKDSLSYHFLSALAVAGKTHVYNEETKTFTSSLLNNPQREINNTTCAEAFVQTFSNHFITNALKAVEHENAEHKKTIILNNHHKAVGEIINLVSNEILNKKGLANFQDITSESLEIIEAHVEDARDKYLNI